MKAARPELMVTLWPSFPHFGRFAQDRRLSGIRLNSAMMTNPELEEELTVAAEFGPTVPLWFDVKGRQPRVVEVVPDPERLIIKLNHDIDLDLKKPCPVLFKAAADHALLERIEVRGDGSQQLVFAPGREYGPANMVRPGESLHIRHPSFRVRGPLFTEQEIAKIEKVKRAGLKRWFLSYVEEPSDLDQFLELVGKDAEVMLKIETEKGLEFVARDFRKTPNLTLVAARGDLYVEVDRPHKILGALKMIVGKDPEAQVGSRILLSVIHEPVPSCADFCELAWLYDIGYRRMMLCDELCLKGDLLATAVNAFEAFAKEYLPSNGASKTAPKPAKRSLISRLFS